MKAGHVQLLYVKLYLSFTTLASTIILQQIFIRGVTHIKVHKAVTKLRKK